MKYVQKHFLKENLCELKVCFRALIPRPVCVHTRTAYREHCCLMNRRTGEPHGVAAIGYTPYNSYYDYLRRWVKTKETACLSSRWSTEGVVCMWLSPPLQLLRPRLFLFLQCLLEIVFLLLLLPSSFGLKSVGEQQHLSTKTLIRSFRIFL